MQSPAYLVAWIADDPGETDNDPFVDSNGRITLLARAFGLFGSEARDRGYAGENRARPGECTNPVVAGG